LINHDPKLCLYPNIKTGPVFGGQIRYFVASSGNVTDEVIMQYIEQQNLEPPDGDFKTDDDL
jgi:hypothetical protein